MSAAKDNSKATVALVKCQDYLGEEEVYRSLKRLLGSLGGIECFVRKGERVLIKPNLLAADEPEKAVTTHPTVVSGIVRLVKEAGAIPLIGDSPSIAKLESVAGATGMAAVAKRHGAILVDLATPTDISLTSGIIVKRVTVAREALDADAIISVSKLKTHNYTIFTGAVKNMFGVVPGLIKSDYHLRMARIEDFSKMLLDVYAAVPARLHIMDGVWGMDGEKGPRSGRPKRVGILIAGSDGIAVDAVATSVVGIDPSSVPTTRIGHAEHKGVGRLEQIEVVGDSLHEVRLKHFRSVKQPGGIADRLPPFLFRLLRNHISNRPRINPKTCELCMTCFKACPPRAIQHKQGDKKLRIDYNKCIRCYCCLESCPHDAVDVKKGLLVRLRWR